MSATPTRRLDRARILDAARVVIREDGAKQLTMRRLGTELGLDPTAVYRHFANKDEILLALGEELFREAIGGYRETDSWREDLATLVLGGREVYAQNPAIAEILAPLPEELPVLQDASELIVGCLRRAGVAEDRLALLHHAVISMIAGAGLYVAVTGPYYDASTRDRLRRSYRSADPATHPNVAALADDLFPDDDVVFDTLLTTLLDGIEAHADRAGKRTSRRGNRS